jgi:hypothetical protein
VCPELHIFSQRKDSPRILQAFREILDITGTWYDFELLFTLLQLIENIRVNLRIANVAIDQNNLLSLSLKRILDDNAQLSEFNLNMHELELLQKLTDYYSKNGMDVINAPLNLMTFFRRALYEYLYKSILSVHCIYHLKLFHSLKTNDSVISFNYDEISDYCLSSLDKLSINSLESLGFADISLPEKKHHEGYVKLLKVHGSFNWTTKINELGNFVNEVYYELHSSNQDRNYMTYGNTPFNLILPYRHKGFIYRGIPIYARHIRQFMDILKLSDQIVLVGKNFLNADKELADLIRVACMEKTKTISIIDPKSEDTKWKGYHESLFNARCTDHWASLKDFYRG